MDNGLLSQKQRDALQLLEGEERKLLIKRIKEFGKTFDPDWIKTDWYPNKDPDM